MMQTKKTPSLLECFFSFEGSMNFTEKMLLQEIFKFNFFLKPPQHIGKTTVLPR
jgi:hypothetical protein